MTTTKWTKTGRPGIYRAAEDDRKFKVVLNLGSATGKRQRVVRVLQGTLRDAETVRAALITKRASRQVRTRGAGHARTVGDWMAYWLETYRKPRVKPQTLERYAEWSEQYIVPALGEHKLTSLNPDDVTEFYNGLSDRLATSTASQVAGLLRVALRQAVRSGHIASNPVDGAEPIRRGPRTRRTLPTIEEVHDLLAALEAGDHAARHIIRFALETGLREGEAQAIRWEDIDLEAGTAYVHRTLVDLPDPDDPTRRLREVKEGGKTPASTATIVLAPSTVAWLKTYKRELQRTRFTLGPRHWQDTHGELAFPCTRLRPGRKAGRPWDGSTLRHCLQNYARKAGIETPLNFHDLRRLFISVAAQRMPLITVRDLARHQNLDTTANVYAQSSLDDRRAGAAALDGVWS